MFSGSAKLLNGKDLDEQDNIYGEQDEEAVVENKRTHNLDAFDCIALGYRNSNNSIYY